MKQIKRNPICEKCPLQETCTVFLTTSPDQPSLDACNDTLTAEYEALHEEAWGDKPSIMPTSRRALQRKIAGIALALQVEPEALITPDPTERYRDPATGMTFLDRLLGQAGVEMRVVPRGE